jgi:hypothetical protein
MRAASSLVMWLDQVRLRAPWFALLREYAAELLQTNPALVLMDHLHASSTIPIVVLGGVAVSSDGPFYALNNSLL